MKRSLWLSYGWPCEQFQECGEVGGGRQRGAFQDIGGGENDGHQLGWGATDSTEADNIRLSTMPVVYEDQMKRMWQCFANYNL